MDTGNRKIVIYGAGKNGRKLLSFFEVLGIKIDCFCQTESSNGLQVEGIPVISFEELSKEKSRMLVLISIGNKEVSRKIRLRLEAVFLEQVIVREFWSFLECNNVLDEHILQKYCILCHSYVDDFLPGAAVDGAKLFEKYHIIGGGYRPDYKCPACDGIDRERWQLWVLSKFTRIFSSKCRVLHFAPETHLSEFIAANSDCDYYTGDIVPNRAMHLTDILDIQYKDEVFDYVVLNHVLEHVEDIGQALGEVKRVLKAKGQLILSFPICTDIDTLEIPEIQTPEERLEYYGQEDHVRLFGRDYLNIISGFGFKVKIYSPRECLEPDDIKRYGFIEDDVLMLCEKI